MRYKMVSLIRRSPNGLMSLLPLYSPLRLLEEVDDISPGMLLTPRVDMYEEEKELVVKTELPGIRKKDMDIRLDGDVLTIKAEKKETKEVKEETCHTRERRFGQYARHMTLPVRVDPDNVTATLKKGLLEIRLPKTEGSGSKQIEIKTK
jgi:HSP20 family protein